MGEGKNSIAASIFELEPTAVIDLYRIYPDYYKKPDLYFNIHNGSVFGQGVIWQGETYMPFPMETEGFSIAADGKPNRPIIRISNNEYFVTALLANNNDFKNARLERRRTFIKYLDAENFEDNLNPWGETSLADISVDYYLISQKRQENKVFVEFELTTPLDIEGFELNNRRILGKYCYWKYRGAGCEYAGTVIERSDGKRFTRSDGGDLNISNDAINTAKSRNASYLGMDGFIYANPNDLYSTNKYYQKGHIVFLTNDKIRIQDDDNPELFRSLLTYYIARDFVQKGKDPENNPDLWEKDGCSKKISACKKRFISEEKVEITNKTANYVQQPWVLDWGTSEHMGYLRPVNNGNNRIKSCRDQLRYYGNGWGTNLGCQNNNNENSLNKEFTIAFHIVETFRNHPLGDNTIYDYNILLTDQKYSYGNFRLHFDARSGKRGVITLNSQYQPSNCGNYNLPFTLIDLSQLESENVDLLMCVDLTVTIRKQNVDGEAVITTTVDGFNKGSEIEGGTGEAGYFYIKKTFSLSQALNTPSVTKLILFSGSHRISAGSKNYVPTSWSQPKIHVGAFAIWNRALENGEISSIRCKKIIADNTESKIIKRYSDIIGSEKHKGALDGCQVFWQTPFLDNGVWYVRDHIRAEGFNGSDLMFKSTDKTFAGANNIFTQANSIWPAESVLNDGYDFISSDYQVDTYAVINSVLVEDAEQGVMPFGGFPGTDGYNYTI